MPRQYCELNKPDEWFFLGILEEEETKQLIGKNAVFRDWIWEWMQANSQFLEDPRSPISSARTIGVLFQITRHLTDKFTLAEDEHDEMLKQTEKMITEVNSYVRSKQRKG